LLPLFFSHAATGWLALLGLAVPLAIYLWNRRPGRVVQVGSVRWLEAAANQRLRSLKPEQLLVFLLRATILGLLALALAEPLQLLPVPPRRGQVLLAPGVTAAALESVRPVLDSLRQRGYELRQLHAARPVSSPLPWAGLGLGDTTTTPTARFTVDSIPTSNLWHTVQLAADSLSNRPLLVVAPLIVASFTGSRPALPAAVRWLPLPAPDSSRWPVAAWQPHPDSLVVLVAQGSELGIRLRKVRRRWPATSGPVPGNWDGQLLLSLNRKQLRVVENGQSRSLPLLTRAPRWFLSHDAAHAASARVLVAALRAVGSVLPLSPRLTVSTASSALPDSLDWLFWLREQPLPTDVASRTQVWQEAGPQAASVATQFLPAGAGQPVAVQRLDTTVTAATVLWPTATGQPLLSQVAPGRYYFHSRLASAWNNLADSPELPGLLLPLLLPAPHSGSTPDARTLDLAQLLSPISKVTATVGPTAPRRLLAPWLVLAASLLFGTERLLAARRAAVSPLTVPVS